MPMCFVFRAICLESVQAWQWSQFGLRPNLKVVGTAFGWTKFARSRWRSNGGRKMADYAGLSGGCKPLKYSPSSVVVGARLLFFRTRCLKVYTTFDAGWHRGLLLRCSHRSVLAALPHTAPQNFASPRDFHCRYSKPCTLLTRTELSREDILQFLIPPFEHVLQTPAISLQWPVYLYSKT